MIRIPTEIMACPKNSEHSDVYQDAILTDTFYGGDRLAGCLSKNAALSAPAFMRSGC